MKKRRLIILAALFAICSTGSAWGGVYQWFGAELPDGTGLTTEWTSGGAWMDEFQVGVHGVVPTAFDKAKVNLVWGNAGPIISSPVAVGEIIISEDPAQPALQTVTVAAGGSLVTGTPGYNPTTNPVGWAGQLNIGYYAANTGEFIMNGGTATITENLRLGWAGKGILQMNGGTLNTNQMFGIGWNGGTGEVHLDGGLLHSAQWWGSTSWLDTHNYTFDISGGTWEIHGWWEAELNLLKDDGWITGYGNSDNVVIAWDDVREITTVTAIIPEPITLSLLGLGALLLRRRS